MNYFLVQLLTNYIYAKVSNDNNRKLICGVDMNDKNLHTYFIFYVWFNHNYTFKKLNIWIWMYKSSVDLTNWFWYLNRIFQTVSCAIIQIWFSITKCSIEVVNKSIRKTSYAILKIIPNFSPLLWQNFFSAVQNYTNILPKAKAYSIMLTRHLFSVND